MYPDQQRQAFDTGQQRTSTALAAEEEAETSPGLAYTRCQDPFTAASKSKAGAAAEEEAAPSDEEMVEAEAGGERYCFCCVEIKDWRCRGVVREHVYIYVCVCILQTRQDTTPNPSKEYNYIPTWKPFSSAPTICSMAACCPRVALRPRSVVSIRRSSSISSVRRSATASRACLVSKMGGSVGERAAGGGVRPDIHAYMT